MLRRLKSQLRTRLRSLRVHQQMVAAAASGSLKLNIGSGGKRQDGYFSVDVRPLPSVDLVATPKECRRRFPEQCSEVYISHVLEHQENPGKAMRRHEDSVLGFLDSMNGLLRRGGKLRVAVPDFEAIAKIYCEGRLPFAPRLLGRLCGEQDYPENLHKCIFDRSYLVKCLSECGFGNVEEWDPRLLGFNHDSSFDQLEGVRTSLNLVAEKR